MDAPRTVNASGGPETRPAAGAAAVRPRRRRLRRGTLLVIAVGLALFVWKLGAHDLWPPDEPRFALVAREMRERGDFVVLSLHDALYTDKPPLFFWAVNGFAAIFGEVDAWAARLPSAIATVLAMLLVVRLGTMLYDRRTGIFAALVFATAVQIAERGRWASLDMTLNLFVLAAIVLFWHGRTRPDQRTAAFRLAWVAMGLATLTKGPVGLLLPLFAAVPAALVARDFKAARRMFLPSGVALYLIVTLAWFGLFAWRLGPGFALDVLMRQNVDRYLDAWNSQHPAWYYLWRFPAGFFPWILFLPWAIAQALGEREEERGHRDAAWFLILWMAAILLFFSFSTGKRGVYIIPIYPAAAILVGRLLARGTARNEAIAGRAPWRLAKPLAIWAGIAALLAAALPLVARRRHDELLPIFAILGMILLAGALGAFLLQRRGRGAAAVACLFGSLVALPLVAFETLVPWVHRHQNLSGFAAEVKARLDPLVPFAAAKEKRDAWVFYIGRFSPRIDSPERIIAWLEEPPPRQLLIDDVMLDRIRPRLPAGAAETLRGRVGRQAFHLITIDAPPAPAGAAPGSAVATGPPR